MTRCLKGMQVQDASEQSSSLLYQIIAQLQMLHVCNIPYWTTSHVLQLPCSSIQLVYSQGLAAPHVSAGHCSTFKTAMHSS